MLTGAQGYSAGSLPPILCRPPSNLSSIRTRRLLVSYPLSVLWALTLFRSSTFTLGLEELMKDSSEVMLVYGTNDNFTGAGKYRSWLEGLHQLAGNQRKLHGTPSISSEASV